MHCPICGGTGVVAVSHESAVAGRTRTTTGIISCRGCGGRGVVPEPERALPGGSAAEDELHTTRQLLVYTLRYSRVFPPETTDIWIEDLNGLDVRAPEAGRVVLVEFREGYEWAKHRHRPGPEATAGDVVAIVFDRETGEIERHIGVLEALMEEVRERIDEDG